MNDFRSYRSLLSFQTLSTENFEELITICYDAIDGLKQPSRPLLNKFIGLLFLCPSTRTRFSFWRGAIELGAEVISLGLSDLQITTGESFLDTSKVLSNYIDALIFRNNASISDYEDLKTNIPVVINAMNNSEHPTQGIADLITIKEHFGYCKGLKIAYFGPGNNIANTLALLFSRLPNTILSFYCPSYHSLDGNILLFSKEQAKKYGSDIIVYNYVPPVTEPVDIIYTTRWRSMGVIPRYENWEQQLKPFRVNKELYKKFAIPGKTVFMHDLPAARGDEVSADIIDGEMSIVWRQAYHKLTSAKVCLMWCFGLGYR